MSDEYRQGDENIYLRIHSTTDGNVALAIHVVGTDEKLYGVILSGESARSTARHLTIASYQAEDMNRDT